MMKAEKQIRESGIYSPEQLDQMYGTIEAIETTTAAVETAKEALRLAAQKLPVKTKFVMSRDFQA